MGSPRHEVANTTGRLNGWFERPAGIGRRKSYRIRLLVQLGFALASVMIGIQFAMFFGGARAGVEPLPARPPGAEAYLPITGLMGLLDWIYQGTLNRVHPAATVLLITFLITSVLLRRSFCSWLCPIGLLSESLARVGQRLFGRNFRLPRGADIALRGLRYALLGFFLWAIFGMSAAELRSFIDSPYNRVADIKMLLFFERIDVLALSVIGFLAAASVLVNGAWCRYLCPYGALLGLASFFSSTKIVRNESACIDCGRCDRACMARLPVSLSHGVGGVECTTCLDCLASCPSPQSLSVRTFSKPIRATSIAAVILLLFAGSYSISRLAGHWHNDISDGEYIRRVAEIDSPAYSHPGSSLRGGSAGTVSRSETAAAAAPD